MTKLAGGRFDPKLRRAGPLRAPRAAAALIGWVGMTVADAGVALGRGEAE